jgi:hypothetical protein
VSGNKDGDVMKIWKDRMSRDVKRSVLMSADVVV